MLECAGLCVQVPGRTLLASIDLCAAPGELLAVLGENGAGKSTLLARLAGDRLPPGMRSRGTVLLGGRAVDAWPAMQRARMRAVVPQQPQSGFAFSALELALLGRYPFGGAASANRKIAEAALALADASHLAAQSAETLSGGERARVALAAAFAQLWEPDTGRARYLLLDEPTAALDLAHQHALLDAARRFATARRIGIVAVLHDLNLAALYADRVVLLRRGCIVACGAPSTVLDSDRVEQVFAVAARVVPHPLRPSPLIATAPLQ